MIKPERERDPSDSCAVGRLIAFTFIHHPHRVSGGIISPEAGLTDTTCKTELFYFPLPVAQTTC